jgi:nucleotide-binding universal stress UspA family protein
MNILVPTDFSEIANTAVRYAAMLAKKLDAKIILFYAVPHHSVWWGLTNDEMVHEAKLKQAGIKEELIKEGMDAGKIEMYVFYQFPINKWINDFIKVNKISFVVVGTKGTTGLKNVMMGSFALGLIEHLSVPVIAVPPETIREGISNILYPTDMEDTSKEIRRILPYAIVFDATLHIVHISKPDISEKLKAYQKLRSIAERTGYEKITTDVKTGTDIESLIEESIREKRADLLVMFPKEKGFFKSLFKGSVTEEISHQISIPLFAIKKR